MINIEDNSRIEPRSRGLMIVCWLQYGIFCIWAIIAPSIIEQFKSVFDAFQGDLRPITVFFFEARYAWWLFPALSLVLVLLVSGSKHHPARYQHRLAIAWTFLTVAAIVAFALCVFAMYSPLMDMGAKG